eukprot:maker-scaffold77_size404793-snap-gene-3.24 protein:Tk04786 transcript:maker-scaffold77_size404793-snap-gene-3.24-mRNA-1 annotation:"PREDICTED: uncharacterized protein LOC101856578"
MKEVQSGFTKPNARPKVLKESVSTAWVDGESALGIVVGDFCMNLAIQKAKITGIGWVSAQRSNHFGIASYYSEMAMEQGMIGMAFTNSHPLMVPTRAKEPTLGSNPIACAAKGRDGDSFSLDMATTSKAAGKIELYRRQGKPIPVGWAVDKEGNPTTDPEAAVQGQPRLMPLGGLEETSGYKGFGLGMMVDIFCGVLSGSGHGPFMTKWMPMTSAKYTEEKNFGQCFMALDPDCFAPGFEGRLQELMDHIRQMDPIKADEPVLIPGDLEKAAYMKTKESGLIEYHELVVKSMNELAEHHKLKPME